MWVGSRTTDPSCYGGTFIIDVQLILCRSKRDKNGNKALWPPTPYDEAGGGFRIDCKDRV